MSRKQTFAGVLLVAAAAALTAGCVTEPAYNLPQTMPAPGQPTYGTTYGTSPYYSYGSGYYGPGYSGYSPGYYSDPMYYGAGPYAYPYAYGYGYPVYIRCPDNNNDGRCDKRVKNGQDNDHDGDHDGNHEGRDQWQPRDGAKYPRDARGHVPLITPKPGQEAGARAPAPNVVSMPAKSPAVVRGDDDDARPRPQRRTSPRDPDPRWVPQR